MTLASEDANSKIVDVVTVADNVDAEKRVDDKLVQIWKLKFGHKVKFLFRQMKFILVEILKLGLVKILKFELSQNADVWLRF